MATGIAIVYKKWSGKIYLDDAKTFPCRAVIETFKNGNYRILVCRADVLGSFKGKLKRYSSDEHTKDICVSSNKFKVLEYHYIKKWYNSQETGTNSDIKPIKGSNTLKKEKSIELYLERIAKMTRDLEDITPSELDPPQNSILEKSKKRKLETEKIEKSLDYESNESDSSQVESDSSDDQKHFKKYYLTRSVVKDKILPINTDQPHYLSKINCRNCGSRQKDINIIACKYCGDIF